MVDVELVIVRSLNYLRSTHLPSYVALRLLLQSVPKKRLVNVVQEIITQVTIRSTPRILDVKRFKSRSSEEYAYRAYSVPSPTAALADSYAIMVLQASGVLKRREHVFSYRPAPDSKYTRNFEHFSSGYRERNKAVHAALMHEGNVAIVADIRSFYPSVQAADAHRRLKLRMADATNISRRDHAIVLAASFRSFAAPDASAHVGLRVGPEMSHVLADIALEDIDAELVKLFEDRYFRYVDDIVVVTPVENLASAQQQLGAALSRAGFSRSEEKDAVVERNEWSGYDAVGLNISRDDLAQLKFRIKLFLARNPDKLESLRKGFIEESVFLPLDLLLQGSLERRWRDRVTEFLRSGWRVVGSYWFDSVENLVEHAILSRHNIIGRAESAMSNANISEDPVSRKWQIQSVRFSVNRALYFAGPEMIVRIRDFAAKLPELAETDAVCAALLGDMSQVIRMPGNAVSAASQLRALRGNVQFAGKDLDSVGSDGSIAVDMIAHFAMRGSIVDSPPRMNLTDDAAGLLAFALAEIPSFDEQGGGDGFGCELAAIGTNFSLGERHDAASTRFSSGEVVVLDALSLGSGYASL